MNKNVILLTSDNKLQLDLAEIFFVKLGYVVRKFLEYDPPENFLNQKVNLIFIILGKVIHDYHRFLHFFKNENLFKNVPIVLLSEYSLDILGIKSKNIDLFLSKPILPKILEQKIVDFFESKGDK